MKDWEVIKQYISTEGYKRNSPDVNNPINIIPSGNITMSQVDFPVLGVGEDGETQMMYPGENYQFKSDMVTEYPMKQDGGLNYNYSGNDKNMLMSSDKKSKNYNTIPYELLQQIAPNASLKAIPKQIPISSTL